MTNIYRIISAIITAAFIFSFTLSAVAKEPKRFEKGDKSIGIYLGASGFGDSSAVTIGGSFQYFVTRSTAPGIKAMGSFSDDNLYQGFLMVDQYLYTRGRVLPFVFAETGYYYSDLVYDTPVNVGGADLDADTRWKGVIYRLGAGVTSFVAENAAIRGEIYYQWFYVDFDTKIPDLTGIGYSAGVSFFL